jgi:LemA protein
MRYNEAVQAYNSQLRQFPQALIGNIAGFETQPYFEAQTIESPKPEP